MKQKPILTEVELERLVRDPPSPSSPLAHFVHYKQPKTVNEQVELRRFINEWYQEHDHNGRMTPKRHDE